jgi:archaemetzincin
LNPIFSLDDGAGQERDEASVAAAVEIIPLNPAPVLACEIAAANIQALLGMPSAVMPPRDIPEYAFLPTRKQYDAGRILKKLEEGRPSGRLRLGITALDLCLPILTYVFGEAHVGGYLAVTSLFRLARRPDGSRVSQALLFERFSKVVLHETAHALGLEHCRVKGCLMCFSVDLEHLDLLTLTFCPGCTRDLVRFKKVLLQKSGPAAGIGTGSKEVNA